MNNMGNLYFYRKKKKLSLIRFAAFFFLIRKILYIYNINIGFCLFIHFCRFCFFSHIKEPKKKILSNGTKTQKNAKKIYKYKSSADFVFVVVVVSILINK